ncbi:MAG: HAMP domain-containing histidine kinase [Burkholderiales bacterium]|nr:HAMP domain-containing histidine kinase [Burkholderiales bacterium]
MKRPRDISLAYKTPLRICALVIITAVLVTASLVLRERDELRSDLIGHSEGVARVLANTLVDPMVHDDVWRVYEIINAPFSATPGQASTHSAELVMVLDAQHMIYVSTRPTEYRLLAHPASVDADYASVQKAVVDAATSAPTAIVAPGTGKLFMVLPIVSDGVEIGTLVMAYSASVFRPRFVALAQRAAWVTAAVLAFLLPAGWYWGRRVARPLVDLAGAMGQVGPQVPSQVEYVNRYRGRDEIGRLGVEFQRMLRGLHEKELLEKQMVASDRLAAIGRLTAGIAHEINNPLGGMLNAINTFKRHGPEDPMTIRTLSLVERGLRQIRETVGALLVEARVENHALTREDIEDTRTLLLADAQAKDARFEWHNEIEAPVPLPSTQTRQILINLLFNAVHAVEPGGRLSCRTALEGEVLRIEVSNDGQHIEADRLPFLFEPFSYPGNDRQGLGLWVTYQIVQQLGGEIRAASNPGCTLFTVSLPLRPIHEPDELAPAVPG